VAEWKNKLFYIKFNSIYYSISLHRLIYSIFLYDVAKVLYIPRKEKILPIAIYRVYLLQTRRLEDNIIDVTFANTRTMEA